MKLLTTTLLFSFFLFTACSSSSGPAEQLQDLNTSFSTLSDPETGLLNSSAAKDYLNKVANLTQEYPKDTAIALHLYRAAEVARATGQAPLAITYYQQITRDFPGFNRLAEANFMLAFTYDENLKDLEKAKTAYENFIQNFPTHDFADDAQMLLKNLGKSDEEILRELESMMETPPTTENN